VRLGSVSIGLDAAHIRWHQANGPDQESKGLALCVLHHKTFDLSAYTVSSGGVLLVSDQANGGEGFQETLMRHHGKTIRSPQRPEWKPESVFLEWDAREVFKGQHGTLVDSPEPVTVGKAVEQWLEVWRRRS
jgi:putative restriction endonuclease